eukprot:TRINITY_DN65797_c0_g1_i1.p1 TRINITY_DN65797_c0_g1~~TRINITY_DN65797_c0_g1_i1.p1  ORF type:complete len:635 (-),score=113.07 TRINITY_DN65797_c0_g1_i1:71-1975(-)
MAADISVLPILRYRASCSPATSTLPFGDPQFCRGRQRRRRRRIRAAGSVLLLACWIAALPAFVGPCYADAKKAEEEDSISAKLAVVSVESPVDMAGRYLGRFGTFSGLSGLGQKALAWTPPAGADGCAEYLVPKSGAGREYRPVVALVRRGNCTFVKKALNAERAGAIGLMLVGDDDDLIIMNGGNETTQSQFFAVSVQKSFGDLVEDCRAAGRRPGGAADKRGLCSGNDRSSPGALVDIELVVNAYVYPTIWNQLLEPYVAIQISVATFLVIAGAYFATADLRPGSPLQREEEVLELTEKIAVAYCFVGSFVLVALYFLMKYAVYVIVCSFCIGGAMAVMQIGSASLQYLFACMRPTCATFPEAVVVEDCSPTVTYADFVASTIAGGLVIGFLWFRNTPYGFIFQNTLGAGFLCTIQRQLRLPNLKVATILLVSMFVFDIFWVFYSHLLFGKSVMVEVAKGGGTGEAVPMLIRIPAESNGIAGERMLGFGDIVLPGLLVSYLLRYDTLKEMSLRTGYFLPSVVAYALGLYVTILQLMVSGKGQPALLYLVPATNGLTLCLAYFRGDFAELWRGPKDSEGSAAKAVADPEDAAIGHTSATERPEYRQRRGQPGVGGETTEMQRLKLGKDAEECL